MSDIPEDAPYPVIHLDRPMARMIEELFDPADPMREVLLADYQRIQGELDCRAESAKMERVPELRDMFYLSPADIAKADLLCQKVNTSLRCDKNNWQHEMISLKLQESETSWVQRADAIRSHYKELTISRLIFEGRIADMSDPDWVFPADLVGQMQTDLDVLDAEYTHDGVHFLKCQFSDILAAYHRGDRVEFEAFGPYLRDYIFQLFGGPEGLDYSKIELTNIDAVGLALMRLIRGELPNAHPTSLYDEYNLGVTASDPVLGTPVNRDNATGPNGIRMERGHLAVGSDIYYAEFRKFVEEMLRHYEAIKPWEEGGPEKDFVLLSETEKIEDAKKLVEVLRTKWLIYENGEEIWFRNTISNCWDPRYLRIQLRDGEGKWQCVALDASGFLDERNRDITHLVILPKENFEEQQDQVWEILRVLGISPRNYHNIHFDADVTPESAVQTFREALSFE